MEAFIVVIVLVTALVLGIDHQQVDSEKIQVVEPSSSKDQDVDGGGSLPVSDPNHRPVILRDLTVPVEQQANDNGY
ncbi:MAG: hypothetical protein GKR95_25065 [Gammaproteobacteria bacterium]|nr:hypothetical protein [Gammaproteobacteria bacterium]